MRIEEINNDNDGDLRSTATMLTGTIICLDTPPNTEFGIDYYSYTVSDQFIGFKNIPLGVHYVYYSFYGGERTSFFLALQPLADKQHSAATTTVYDSCDRADQQQDIVVILKYDPTIEDYRILTCNSGKDQSFSFREPALSSSSSAQPSHPDPEQEHQRRRQQDNELVSRILHEYTHMTSDRYLRLADYPMTMKLTTEHEHEQESHQEIVNQYQVWKSLSHHITPEVIARLEPIHKKIMSAGHLSKEERKKLGSISNSSTGQAASTTISYKVFYTKIPKRLKKGGLSGSDLTKLNFDKSDLLVQLLKYDYNDNQKTKTKNNNRSMMEEEQELEENERKQKQQQSPWQLLLGELQFSFVCFLMGHALDGLEQWKRLIELVCNCDDAVHNCSLTEFFAEFVRVLSEQLSVVPSDFFHDELSGNNFLRQQLSSWFEIVGVSALSDDVESSTVDREIVKRTIELKRLLLERFQVSLDDIEDMEDAPTIVDWM